MKVVLAIVTGISLLLGVREPASADTYRWVDRNGTIHYQDYPPGRASPATKVKRVRTLNGGTGTRVPPPASPDAASGSPAAPSGATNAQTTVLHPKVEIYGTAWCPYCQKARDFFRSRGIPFMDYDIEKDEAARRRKSERDPDAGVPTTVIGGKVFHGFSESAYERALKIRP